MQPIRKESQIPTYIDSCVREREVIDALRALAAVDEANPCSALFTEAADILMARSAYLCLN